MPLIKSSEKGLMPNAMVVKTADGGELVLPSDKSENAIANKIVAAQIRQILTSQIKKYKDSDQTMSPKEIKDLAEAGKALAQFSGEVYKDNEEVSNRRKPDATEVKADEVVFDDLAKKPE